METFALVMSVIIGDPETGPVHEFVIEHGVPETTCEQLKTELSLVWLGNNSIGMYCEAEQ